MPCYDSTSFESSGLVSLHIRSSALPGLPDPVLWPLLTPPVPSPPITERVVRFVRTVREASQGKPCLFPTIPASPSITRRFIPLDTKNLVGPLFPFLRPGPFPSLTSRRTQPFPSTSGATGGHTGSHHPREGPVVQTSTQAVGRHPCPALSSAPARSHHPAPHRPGAPGDLPRPGQ